MTRAAWRAWTRGDVEAAGRLAGTGEPRLRFLTAYVGGRYADALAVYPRRLPRRLHRLAAQALLHLDRPDDAVALLRRHHRRVDAALTLRACRPVRSRCTATTVVPFADDPLAPYLPAVAARVDGHDVRVHLDTGGTFLVMGTSRAAALGIDLVRAGSGFHGTGRVDAYAGTAAELRIGDATLTDVPVRALPSLVGPQDVVLVGTNVLARFRATVDHPAARLVLEPRGRPPTHPPGAVRVPFHLWGEHLMFARGGFGAHRRLTFFVDSGLVHLAGGRQASLYATAAACRAWGVTRAEAARAEFTAREPLTLGPVRQDAALVAIVPARRPPWRSFGGVRVDALLAGGFLRRQAWTLDFDRFEYVFGPAQPAGASSATAG